MNFFKLLIIGAIVWLALLLFKRHLVRPKREHGKAPRIGAMVRCAVCGLHVPETEAVTRDGRHFCSTAHRDQTSG